MADTHEEQLLSDLLRGIARDDARLDAAHLESRVMTSALAGTMQQSVGTTGVPHWAVAAAIAVAVLVPALLLMNADVAPHNAKPAMNATEEIVAETPTVVVPTPSAPARTTGTQRSFPTRPARRTIPTRPAAEPLITQSLLAQTPDEFLPLMPITEQELTGSFQIVRVQMPRASLGALRSPLEHPNELIEADVLLGEDGMARAIRVSTSGSVYPWRSR
jgi:hypothetical protein